MEILSQGKLLASVSGVEWKSNVPHLKKIEDFVLLVAGLNSIGGIITRSGEEELLQKDKNLVVGESGNPVVRLSGKEMKQLAKDAEKNLIILKEHLKSTTLNHFGQENKEKIARILSYYVISAISGFIPQKIKNKNLLTLQIRSSVGYTFGISNTQRYKSLGNAFNVDVIAHILKHFD